jgi:hypothetical protein
VTFLLPARPRAITRVVFVTVTLLLGAGACTSGGSVTRHAQAFPRHAQASPGLSPVSSVAGITFVPQVRPGVQPKTLAGYYAQRLAWVPCDQYFQCARLWVPFDYARPGGRAFSLPVCRRQHPGTAVRPGRPGGRPVLREASHPGPASRRRVERQEVRASLLP